jgi:hypothetical protein
MTAVFISHSSQDLPVIQERILPVLAGHGIRPWYYQNEMGPGEYISPAVLEGLQKCEWFLVVLSPRSAASRWVQNEVAWAMGHRQGRIRPVKIDECEAEKLHLGLADMVTANLHREYFRELTALLRSLGLTPAPHQADFTEEAIFQESYLSNQLVGPPVSASVVDYLLEFARDADDTPLVLLGPPTSGHTSILAQLTVALRRSSPEGLVLPYFVGSRQASSRLDALLRRFCVALERRFGLGLPIPIDTDGLARTFAECLNRVPEGERVVLVIDGLERLQDDDGGSRLEWLPGALPAHVKVVASCTSERQAGLPTLPALRERTIGFCLLDPIGPDCVRFEFVGYGSRAPDDTARSGRLYLDVGNALRAGVIDNHHLGSMARSSASLVVDCAGFVRDSFNPAQQRGAPFTIVLHHNPDLDCVAAAYLAIHYLTEGAFPPGHRALCNYVDRIDQGYPGVDWARPHSLYAAHLLIGHLLGKVADPQERWRRWVEEGLKVIEYVMGQLSSGERGIPDIDAFACPGALLAAGRDEIGLDRQRYRALLARPQTNARRYQFRLPGVFGGKSVVPALLVRDVQGPGVEGRCVYFKDWARTDPEAPGGTGYTALSVFMHDSAGKGRGRCILSVEPDGGVALEGLGEALERAEVRRRLELHGRDERLTDLQTGMRLPDRAGYANPDPWYDGRDHGYTIVDAPRAGSVLTPDEVEAVFIHFGAGQFVS